MYKKPAMLALTVSLSSFILGINLTNINTAKQVFSTCSTQNTIIKSCILTTTSQWAFLIALLSLGAPITALFHTTLFKYFYILISKHIYPNPSSYINKNKDNSSIDINRDRYDRYDRFDITNDNTTTTTNTTNNTNTNPTTLHILLLANLLYITSTLLFTTCTSYTILCISRIITGMAVGLTSISVPSFLTNTSKFIKNYHQIFIILGIFFGQIFSFIFYTLETWKIPFYILFLVIILHSTLLYFKKIEISEYNSIGDCVSIVNTVDLYPNPSLTLNKCINNKDTKKDCNNRSDNNNCNNCESNNCNTNNHSTNRDCNNSSNNSSNNNTLTNNTITNNTTPNNTIITNTGNTLVISLLTHILQQLSCINGVIQYTSLLISNNIPYTLLIITINITMIIFTLISILLKMERKKIFLISNLLTLVGLMMLSSSLNVLISLFVYLIGFTIGLGPIPWQLVGGNSKVGDSVNDSVDNYKGVNDKDNYKGANDKDMVVGVNNSVDNYKGVIKSVDGYKGVSNSVDGYKGVNDSIDGYKGVNDSVHGYKGVNDSKDSYEGVNNSKDSYKGVSNSVDGYKGVSNSVDGYKGVSNSVNGYNPVNNSIDNYNPVNNSTNEQHPFNNLSDNYHPVNNSILTQHPFKNTLNTYNPVNTKTKCYSNTVIAKTCVTVNWLTCFIFSYIFPITHDYMGKRCYLLYACICSVIYTYIYIKGDNVI